MRGGGDISWVLGNIIRTVMAGDYGVFPGDMLSLSLISENTEERPDRRCGMKVLEQGRRRACVLSTGVQSMSREDAGGCFEMGGGKIDACGEGTDGTVVRDSEKGFWKCSASCGRISGSARGSQLFVGGLGFHVQSPRTLKRRSTSGEGLSGHTV